MKTKIMILILPVFLLVIVGCNKDNNINSATQSFNVKVENASEYSNVVEVKLMVCDENLNFIELARGEWKGDGFIVELPETINPNYLNLLFGANGLLPTTIQPSTLTIIGNKNAKVVREAYFFGYDIDGNRVANFMCYDNAYPYWNGSYNLIYTNSDVTISGYVEEKVLAPYADDIPVYVTILYEWEKTTTYSIECKRGWSILRSSSLQAPPPVLTITEEYSTVPNDRVNWRGSTDY